MNNAYAQGFIQKCAEAGVDPEQLVKTAVRGDMLGKLMMLGERAAKAFPGAGAGLQEANQTINKGLGRNMLSLTSAGHRARLYGGQMGAGLPEERILRGGQNNQLAEAIRELFSRRQDTRHLAELAVPKGPAANELSEFADRIRQMASEMHDARIHLDELGLLRR